MGLVGGIIWALFVATALWPPFRHGRLGFGCFLLTMVVNEVPLVFLVLVAVSATAPGSSADVAAWLSLPLFAFVVVGLSALQIRALTTRPTLERALDAELGVAPHESTSWWRGILLPFQRHDRNVVRLRNQSYGPFGRDNLLDVYRNRDDNRRPILVHLHSGGFIQGAKSREGVALLNQMAAHGWLCVSANYRLRDAGAHPNPLVDTKRVIAWVRDHAAELGADPDRVVLVGSSAGAHLAASAALTANDPLLQPGFEDADTTVAAVVSLYGYLGPRTADPSSSPTSLIHPCSPPFLLIEGGNDTALPPGVAAAFSTALREVSASPVVRAVLPGAQHNFDWFASVRARGVADGVEAFLDWSRTQPLPS